ncbi:hypothetical protein [Natronobacterium texcoconense]|uniref:Uncharacterized protein n=1 Tax=Natronobacterium texcoconense TaxID=1095778 RepID=A0A1H1CMH3_NATTX|nr:hypothetical protein [Natronobacterium texcoconense]SDQ64806.1 hypothetical protein SAMN04489842_1442 [Natronobacterium texcoconense]
MKRRYILELLSLAAVPAVSGCITEHQLADENGNSETESRSTDETRYSIDLSPVSDSEIEGEEIEKSDICEFEELPEPTQPEIKQVIESGNYHQKISGGAAMGLHSQECGYIRYGDELYSFGIMVSSG